MAVAVAEAEAVGADGLSKRRKPGGEEEGGEDEEEQLHQDERDRKMLHQWWTTYNSLLSLASAPPSPTLEALRSLDPDNLSAKAALDSIYQLKQKLDDET